MPRGTIAEEGRGGGGARRRRGEAEEGRGGGTGKIRSKMLYTFYVMIPVISYMCR